MLVTSPFASVDILFLWRHLPNASLRSCRYQCSDLNLPAQALLQGPSAFSCFAGGAYFAIQTPLQDLGAYYGFNLTSFLMVKREGRAPLVQLELMGHRWTKAIRDGCWRELGKTE